MQATRSSSRLIRNVCARHGALLAGAPYALPFGSDGKSRAHPGRGEVLVKGKCVVARRGLKEVESKALTRRTATAYEAGGGG